MSGELTSESILECTALQVANNIRSQRWSAVDVMQLTLLKANTAHDQTNCITEIFPEEALRKAEDIDRRLREGEGFPEEDYPFLGIPFPVKDMIDLKGHGSIAGYRGRSGHIAEQDATLVASFRRLGAIPFCKTNVPQYGMSLETSNTINGTTTNPFNPRYTPGGSGGGCAALMGAGGCQISLGSDIAGSVRAPASFCGLYSFKPTPAKLPARGHIPTLAGQQCIPGALGFVARKLTDVETLFRSVSKEEHWKTDSSIMPLPYSPVDLSGKKLRIGYFVTDGKFPASPANERAVMDTVEKLQKAGHDVFPFRFPDAEKVFGIQMKLLFADGFDNIFSFNGKNEPLDRLTWPVVTVIRLPSIIKRTIGWILEKGFGQKFLADYINLATPPSVGELWRWQGEKMDFEQNAQDAWQSMTTEGKEMDAVISPVSALPNNEHYQFYKTFPTYWFSILYNLLGYPAGVIPCTKVNPAKDTVDMKDWLVKNVKDDDRSGTWSQYLAYKEYNPAAMSGLPVGIQIAGMRFKDEHTLEVMRIIDEIINP